MSDTKLTLCAGNAVLSGASHRGWFLGDFLEDGHPLKTDKMEARVRVHSKGKTSTHVKGRPVATLTILISGKFKFTLPEGREYVLERPFDFIYVDPGQKNSWEALEDSVTITIRTPSLPL